jgi:hypothetical protein
MAKNKKSSLKKSSRKSSPAAYSARSIFRLGNAYFEASELLAKAAVAGKKDGEITTVAHDDAQKYAPVESTRGLAAELFFKCLLVMHNLPVPSVHGADNLHRALPLAVQLRISKKWDDFYKSQEHRYTNPVFHDPNRNFKTVLADCSDAFVYFRYMFERTPAGPKEYWTRSIAKAAHDVILDLNPSWQ